MRNLFFQVYGINVDPRHLLLIADYMTFDGTYKPLNRVGMDGCSSPFQQMSFESTLKYLKNAVVYNLKDNVRSPSSSLVVGTEPKVGCGLMKVFHEIQWMTWSENIGLKTKISVSTVMYLVIVEFTFKKTNLKAVFLLNRFLRNSENFKSNYKPKYIVFIIFSKHCILVNKFLKHPPNLCVSLLTDSFLFNIVNLMPLITWSWIQNEVEFHFKSVEILIWKLPDVQAKTISILT